MTFRSGEWAQYGDAARTTTGDQRMTTRPTTDALGAAVSMTADLGGPLHYLRHEGPEGAPPVVLVHGLSGSHLDFAPLIPLLATRFTVYVPDLPGAGYSPIAARPVSASDSAGIVERFVREVSGGPALLVGNSFGGLISLLLAGGRPDLVAGVALIDTTQPIRLGSGDPRIAALLTLSWIPRADAVLARHRTRTSPREQVLEGLELMSPGLAERDPDLVEAMVELAADPDRGRQHDISTILTARSCFRWLARPGKHHRMMSRVRPPVLMLHGSEDKVIPVRWATLTAARNPHWRSVVVDGAGHLPQLDDPGRVAGLILSWAAESVRLEPPAGAPDGTVVDGRPRVPQHH